MNFVEIYADGSCKKNPGPGGYGAILFFTDKKGERHKKEISEGYALTTNNRMELLGVISALKILKIPCDVKIYSDSTYVVNGASVWAHNWRKNNFIKRGKPVPNADLWRALLELTALHSVTFVWVKGHTDNIYNIRADELASEAAKNAAKKD